MTYAWERVLHVRCVRKPINYVPLALLCSVDATGFRLDKKAFTHLNRCVKDAKVRVLNKNQGKKGGYRCKGQAIDAIVFPLALYF